MNFRFYFVDDAESQIKEIDNMAIIKRQDSTKNKAKIVSSMPIKWMPLLKKKSMEGFGKDTDEYVRYKQPAIEIIQKRAKRKKLSGQSCDSLAEFYNDFETDIRRIKPTITDDLLEDMCIENLLKSLPENQRIVAKLKKPYGLSEMMDVCQE
ncbi:hypothetical protein RF11_00445 [Thelohanellus kitauei]|uniref:Uncharacterized protein n=1 Tax=Thelohanellus kitauei TaxID=669202 RepID=A0A0C2N5D9_THEKT|nr:hypothetical protein RF11_00445 [Thelohanellus kitauei]